MSWTQEETTPRILRPADQSVLEPGAVAVIAKASGGAEVRLDGKRVASSQPAAGVFTATISLRPGFHELTLATAEGERRVRILVRSSSETAEPPPGWGSYRVHPPADGCENCHAVREGKWHTPEEAVAESCFGCHRNDGFPGVHTHNSRTLEECQLCHDPHGSKEKWLLKMPRETACKLCHG